MIIKMNGKQCFDIYEEEPFSFSFTAESLEEARQIYLNIMSKRFKESLYRSIEVGGKVMLEEKNKNAQEIISQEVRDELGV